MDEEIRVCDICDEPIEDGSYYEMPDGLTVCCDSDCLEEWALEYKRCGHYSLT